MKEKYIRRLKKLMFNLEGAKALTYYYAGDEYYHRVHTPEHKIDPKPFKPKTVERIREKINKLGENGEYLLPFEIAVVYQDKDFLHKMDKLVADTQYAKSLYEYHKKVYEDKLAEKTQQIQNAN